MCLRDWRLLAQPFHFLFKHDAVLDAESEIGASTMLVSF